MSWIQKCRSFIYLLVGLSSKIRINHFEFVSVIHRLNLMSLREFISFFIFAPLSGNVKITFSRSIFSFHFRWSEIRIRKIIKVTICLVFVSKDDANIRYNYQICTRNRDTEKLKSTVKEWNCNWAYIYRFCDILFLNFYLGSHGLVTLVPLTTIGTTSKVETFQFSFCSSIKWNWYYEKFIIEKIIFLYALFPWSKTRGIYFILS